MRDQVLIDIFSRRQATRDVARACGVTSQAVSRWRTVPQRHLETVAAVVGRSVAELRPDLAQAPN